MMKVLTTLHLTLLDITWRPYFAYVLSAAVDSWGAAEAFQRSDDCDEKKTDQTEGGEWESQLRCRRVCESYFE